MFDEMTFTIPTVKLLYDYHYWANARMLNACEALTPDQWGRSHGHSWGRCCTLPITAHTIAANWRPCWP